MSEIIIGKIPGYNSNNLVENKDFYIKSCRLENGGEHYKKNNLYYICFIIDNCLRKKRKKR